MLIMAAPWVQMILPLLEGHGLVSFDINLCSSDAAGIVLGERESFLSKMINI